MTSKWLIHNLKNNSCKPSSQKAIKISEVM